LAAAKIDRQFGALGLPSALIWTPYAYLVKHRSPLSHWPVVGTIGRLLYLASLAGALLAILRPALLSAALSWLQAPPLWLFFAAAGLAAADSLHWLMDKKKRPRRWRGR
jgi:uncharacterized metal-binding protein